MRLQLSRAALAAALTIVLAAPLAHAEIYTWVDAQGRVNVGNLPPPEGARVTRIVREAQPSPYNDAAREAAHKAEVDTLARRVDQLQSELQSVASQPPPQPVAAPAPQIVMVPMPVSSQYFDEPVMVQPQMPCAWVGCSPWYSAGFAPLPTVIVVPSVARPYPGQHRGWRGRPGHDGFEGGYPNNGRGNGNYRAPPRSPMRVAATPLVIN